MKDMMKQQPIPPTATRWIGTGDTSGAAPRYTCSRCERSYAPNPAARRANACPNCGQFGRRDVRDPEERVCPGREADPDAGGLDADRNNPMSVRVEGDVAPEKARDLGTETSKSWQDLSSELRAVIDRVRQPVDRLESSLETPRQLDDAHNRGQRRQQSRQEERRKTQEGGDFWKYLAEYSAEVGRRQESTAVGDDQLQLKDAKATIDLLRAEVQEKAAAHVEAENARRDLMLELSQTRELAIALKTDLDRANEQIRTLREEQGSAISRILSRIENR